MNYNTIKRTVKSSMLKWYQKPLNWFLIIVGIIIAFPLFRYIKAQLEKNKEQNSTITKNAAFVENQNPITRQKKADVITTRKDIQAAAESLAHDLGTKYSDQNSWFSWLNPRGWTENDKSAADTLIKQRLNFKLLEKLYFTCYSNSRSLHDDVLQLLDEEELKRVRKYLTL